MNLIYVLGLLALLAVPVIIFIYIIKNKYTEQTISSTYLWTLSEKFIRRRIPVNRIVGILSLILQIIAAALLALLLAHPVLVIPHSASAYCFVLDGSGSMNFELDGKTRFEKGKEMISDIISDATEGSTYTLIFCGSTTDTIYKDITDKDSALKRLASLKTADTTPDFLDILSATQEYFDGNHAANTYLVTDVDYGSTKNVKVLNVAEGYEHAQNYSLFDVDYTLLGTQTEVKGKAVSYGDAANIKVEIYFSGDDGVFYKGGEQTVALEAGGTGEFSVTCDVGNFGAVKAVIADKDNLAPDNEVILYNASYESIGSTLLVSDNSFFPLASLTAAGNDKVDVVTTKQYEELAISGYGLYIYDSYAPETLPYDGAVWFINPRGSTAGAGFTYQTELSSTPTNKLSSARFLSDPSEYSLVSRITDGISTTSFELERYVRCGITGDFTTVATCGNDPIAFVGSNEYGNREAVLAFSLNSSGAFTLSANCVTLFSNILKYMFPAVVENTSYTCGDILPINVISGCATIRVCSPGGDEVYLNTASVVSEYKLTEAGTYRIVMLMNNGAEERVYNVYANLPESERIPNPEDIEFVVDGLASDSKFDGYYDNILIIFIILAVFFAADYGVYCYEQYQLR